MSHSGRINLDNCNTTPYKLYENVNIFNKTKYNQTGNQQSSELSKRYFTQSNIDYLQNEIIRQIYKKTYGKYNIVKQKEDELVIIMKSIFLQNSRNNDNNIKYQIDELNKLVLNYCVDNVYSNLHQYIKYIDDITKEQVVLDRPQNVDITGCKTLMPNYFI